MRFSTRDQSFGNSWARVLRLFLSSSVKVASTILVTVTLLSRLLSVLFLLRFLFQKERIVYLTSACMRAYFSVFEES